jgi:hypothetical protein
MADTTSPNVLPVTPRAPAPAQAAPSAPHPAALPQQPANAGPAGTEKKS